MQKFSFEALWGVSLSPTAKIIAHFIFFTYHMLLASNLFPKIIILLFGIFSLFLPNMHKRKSNDLSSSSSACRKTSASAAAGAKSARACDCCIGKTAGWYCPADDAFLCQSCDRSVHSANLLARRHQRVPLKIHPLPRSISSSSLWDSGFTRKPRTPRRRRCCLAKKNKNCHSYRQEVEVEHTLVPEVNSISDENSHLDGYSEAEDEEEEELLYRVPILDPSVAEMCTSGEGKNIPAASLDFGKKSSNGSCYEPHGVIVPSDFATEVESLLLGKVVDGEEPLLDIEELGLLSNFSEEVNVSLELTDGGDDSSPALTGEDERVEVGERNMEKCSDGFGSGGAKMMCLLKLDYESVITEWAARRCPWSSGGGRPHLDPYDSWSDLKEGRRMVDAYAEMGAMRSNGHPASASASALMDEGRKERVWRYREKRRKRLFSKKIRYQVRKLNAEKRPRMKGRFVKRSNPCPVPTN
ncbi:unnamed protein product [Cuscuta europaea]|uniref:Uncharacterized protein n=1 Tax=Cuscuta europaea TaxID=41803 RepID=A0A9P0ZWD6_CUSEU|nr:unnamed protein product [Cuscuta europaea]